MPGHSAHQGRRRAVHGVAGVAGVAIAVAVVAGCASRNGLSARSDKSAGGAIQFAAAQIVAEKSVHVHGTLSGDPSGAVDGSLVFAPALQGELTLKLDNGPVNEPTRILFDGTTYYASLPKSLGLTSKAKPNAAWFAISTTSLVPKDSAVLAALKSDPAALVKELLAKGKFTQTGTGTIDGVGATHFAGDVAGSNGGHIEVWLDASGLPVEIVAQSAAGPDKQSTDRTELHFSQWGKPVTITAPAADQVITEKDEAAFAISGQQFTISGDQLDGSTFAQSGSASGNGNNVIIDNPPSSGPTQQVCIPHSDLPSQTQSGQPVQPAPTSLCFTIKTPVTPTHP